MGVVPSVRRGQTVPVNKTPALHLIDRMMQDDPDLRRFQCLQDPWMATINNSESVLTQKRGRSQPRVRRGPRQASTSQSSSSSPNPFVQSQERLLSANLECRAHLS